MAWFVLLAIGSIGFYLRFIWAMYSELKRISKPSRRLRGHAKLTRVDLSLVSGINSRFFSRAGTKH